VKVVRGEVGFCFGVQRAINILDLGKGNSIVPNRSSEVLAITAHGASPDILRKAYEKGIAVLDTTCPTVKKAQEVVESLAHRGTPVVIFGDANHTEVKGMIARNNRAWVAEKPFRLNYDDYTSDYNETICKVGLVSQTTKSLDSYFNFFVEMYKLNPNVFFDYHETICKSVTRRMDKAREVSQDVDLMLVVGDKMSANTKNLVSICSGIVETYLIESRDDIDERWLKGKKVIGITSGTSTPMRVIGEVEKYLLRG